MRPVEDARRASVRLAEPHKRLMAAVLRAVVDDCRAGSLYRRSAGHAPIGLRHVRDARAYVSSTDRVWPFSFENLCEALSLNAGRLRRKLQEERLPTGDYTHLVEALENES